MQFKNQFEVSLPPDQAWPLLMDVKAIVPCMPGAEIVDVIDDRNYRAKISTRLGPVAMTFLCDLTFTEIDQDTMKAKVKGRGADIKGRGDAEATVSFRCLPSAVGTLVTIDTELALTGAVAQYGRGASLIQTVANQIIGQFAKNLELRIAQLREHGISFDKSAALTGSSLTPTLPPTAYSPAGSASEIEAVSSSVTVNGSYPQGYQDGYGAGFATGHAAGFALARDIMEGVSPIIYKGPAGSPTTPADRAQSLPPFKSKPIGGLSLIARSLWASIRGMFSKS